jgi:hypothetical protein
VLATHLQRCGIGSSCGCAPHDKLAGIQRDLQRATASGTPLPPATRTQMEGAFAADFSGVRLHTGPASHDTASSLHAHAFTAGTDIVFRSGAYRPGTPTGDRLLAHELAHVVQQARRLPRAAIDGGSSDPLEQAADHAADHASPAAEREAHGAAEAATHGAPLPELSGQPVTVARQDLDAGVPTDAGVPADAAPADPAHRSDQTNCVIRLGGCASSRPAGIPTAEEIAAYNTLCRPETSYVGPDVTPTDEECRTPPVPGSQPGAAMICSKRLEYPVIGWFANHAYIDDTGRGDCHGSRLVGNYAVQDLVPGSGNFINGCAVKTDTSTDPQEFEPNIKPCDPQPGVGDVHVCLRAAYNAYTNPSEYSNDPRRRPWGPNSNTFAATLAKACCVDSSDGGLGWVPGWDHAPAGPCSRPVSAEIPEGGRGRAES